LAVAASPLLLPARAWAKKVAVRLSTLGALKTVGGWTVVTIKGKEILLIRDAQEHVSGVHPHCTHQKARLSYDPASNQIVCKQHGSRFDLTGKVLKGPATKNLQPLYPATLDRPKDRIVIEL
jgi:nitrite reductase/ring-hydroxylating ferredoxin subunit